MDDKRLPVLEKYLQLSLQTRLCQVVNCDFGCGIVATKDLPVGTLLFKEPPLVLGPRQSDNTPVCLGCHSRNPQSLCSHCQMPICSKPCETSLRHVECHILAKLQQLPLSQRIPLIAPLRSQSLDMNERKILASLEGHIKPNHLLLLEIVKPFLTQSDLQVVHTCCKVLDATAFEVACGQHLGSLRGIFPAAAMLNHHCSPNTSHCFDMEGNMYVQTTRAVKKGDELFTTYTCLTWGTQARRAHLMATKKFQCECNRCLDPEEGKANLMALYCPRKGCGGRALLPSSSAPNSTWNCRACSQQIPAFRVQVIQAAIARGLSSINKSDMKQQCKILQRFSFVPNSNEAAVEFKMTFLRFSLHPKNLQGLSQDELDLCEIICQELILLFGLLSLNYCRKAGLVMIDLLSLMNERKRRGSNDVSVLGISPITSWKHLYEEAEKIFKYDFITLQRLNKHQLT